MKVDINKKYQTRDGRRVLIYHINEGGSEPVDGSYQNLEYNNGVGEFIASLWTMEGVSFSDRVLDLVEVKKLTE